MKVNFLCFKPSVVFGSTSSNINPAEGIAGGPYISIGDPSLWHSPSLLSAGDRFELVGEDRVVKLITMERKPRSALLKMGEIMDAFESRAAEMVGEITPHPEALREQAITAVNLVADDIQSYKYMGDWLSKPTGGGIIFISVLTDVAGSDHTIADQALRLLHSLTILDIDTAKIELTLLLTAQEMGVDTNDPSWRATLFKKC